ncbi:hypothetical protein A6456_34945 [Paraburkholderia tropica]|nr:hypothetical protein A6456_34945 [Paraburkholderia tropica]
MLAMAGKVGTYAYKCSSYQLQVLVNFEHPRNAVFQMPAKDDFEVVAEGDKPSIKQFVQSRYEKQSVRSIKLFRKSNWKSSVM